MTDVVVPGMAGERCWTYWVSYRHRAGLDAAAVSLGLPLRAACQLSMLARRIERDADVRDVVVLSWQELVAPEGGAAGAVSLPGLAVHDVIAAAERAGNPVTALTVDGLAGAVEVSVHLTRRASTVDAGSLLAELGFSGEMRTREIRADRPFAVCSGEVEVAGDAVVVSVYCEVPA